MKRADTDLMVYSNLHTAILLLLLLLSLLILSNSFLFQGDSSSSGSYQGNVTVSYYEGAGIIIIITKSFGTTYNE